MSWKVGTKISAGFGITLVILVVLGIASYRNVEQQLEDAAWVNHSHEVQNTVVRLISALQGAETGQRGYLITGDVEYLAPHTAGSAAVKQHLAHIAQLVSDNPRQATRIEQLGRMIDERLAIMQEGIDMRRTRDFAAAQQFIIVGAGKRSMDDISALVETISSEEQNLLQQRAQAAASAARLAELTILIGTALALVFAATAGVLITRNVARPLGALTSAAQRITIGDLGTNIDVGERSDEVGVLASAFQRMTQSLRALAGVAERIAAGDLRATLQPQSPQDVLGHAIVKMIENLRAQIGGIVEGANVLGSAASEIVASTAQLASGASESAAAVSETTTTVEEIRQTAQMASQKARTVAETAQKAVQVAIGGRKSTEEAISGMGRIRTQMESIGDSMMRLSEQTQAIGQIMATVEDLAAQSNLLAVNAAIEAAKAGEQGKGFSVVAQEVKSLAEQSRGATERVRSILGDIQKATTAAVMATEQGNKAVEAGNRQSEVAGEAIHALTGNVTEAAQAATQIAASSQQQLVGMDQVAGAMENIKQASTQNVASARQLETAARNLSELGQRMKKLVDNYSL